MKKLTRKIKFKNFYIGGDNPFVLITGPCVIENKEKTEYLAFRIKEITSKYNIPFIFKASYDKANRSSINSFRGPGLELGLKILEDIKKRYDILILSDIHNIHEIEPAACVLDIIQIPAFLCRQTDLIVEASKTKKVVNIKKGQFMSPYDMQNVINKFLSTGNKNLMLTERGVTFGYNNLVVDMRSLVIMRELGYPVVFDATHSVQLPGGKGTSSGGERKFVSPLARAAIAIGIDALYLEVAENPDCALCDGPNSINLDDLSLLLEDIIPIDNYVKGKNRE